MTMSYGEEAQEMTIEEWEAAKKRLPSKFKNVKV